MNTVRPVLGAVMVSVGAVFWGLNGTVSKLLIRGGFEPLQLTTFRVTGAFLVLLPLILVTRGPRSLATGRREVGWLSAYGLLGLFLVPLLYFVAISRLPVGIGLLFEFTAPVFTALWIRFVERRPVRRRLWVGLALCVAGLVSVAQLWSGSLRLDLLGMAAGTGSAVLLAAYYLIGARFVAGTTDVGTDTGGAGPAPRRDPLTLACWGFGVAAAAGAVIRPWWRFDPGVLDGRSGATPMWLLATYLVVFGTVVPYLLITFAMAHLPPTSVGIIGMVEILAASAFAWPLLGEVLTGTQIVGGVVLVLGVALAESARVATARSARGSTVTGAGSTVTGAGSAAAGAGEAVADTPRGEAPTVPAGR